MRPIGSTFVVLSTLLLMLSSISATAGVNTFTSIGPAGGVIHDVAFHPTDPSIAYAAGDRAFFRSVDGGMTWQMLHQDIYPRVIAVHPIAPSRVIVFTAGSGLLVSNDAGATLTPVADLPRDLPVMTQVSYSGNGAALYVAAGDQIYRSINQGFSWETRGTVPIVEEPNIDLSVDTLTVDPANPNQLFVTSAALQRYQSADGGATWTSWTAPSGYLFEVAIAPGAPRRFWFAQGDGLSYSDEEGANWWRRDEPSVALAVHPTSSSTLYSAAPHILRRSTNNGASWSDVMGTARIGTISRIVFQPGNDNHLLISGTNGIMGSLDGGNTWSLRNHGIDAVSVPALIASPASDRIYARTALGGLYAISGENRAITPLNNDALRALDPARATILSEGLAVVPGAQDFIFTGLPSGVARSFESGSSWSLSTHSDFSTSQLLQVAAVSENGQTLLAMTRDGLYRSTNQGDDWTRVTSVADARVMTPHFSVAPSNRMVAYLVAVPLNDSDASGLYRTNDGGSQWTRVVGPAARMESVAVDYRDENVVYVTDWTHVFKSVDGGQSWSSTQLAGFLNPIALDPQNSDIVYAGGTGRIFRSVDAARTWQTIPLAGSPGHFVSALAIDPLRPHTIYAGLQSGGVQETRIQPDLTLRATVPTEPFAYAQPVTYTYAVENLGPFDATRVRVQVQLPESATNIAAIASSGNCTTTTRLVSCIAPVLYSTETMQVSIASTQSELGQFQITGSVSADQPDAQSADNQVTSSIQLARFSDLSIDLSGVTQIARGSSIEYVVDIRNAGPNDALDATTTIELASGLSISTVAPSLGTCSTSGNTATCTLPSVGVDSTERITLTTQPTSTAGSFTTRSSITSRDTDPQSSNNNAAVMTDVIAPASPIAGGSRSPSGGGGGGGSMSWPLLGLLFWGLFRTHRYRDKDFVCTHR